jgi:hypothetical protein
MSCRILAKKFLRCVLRTKNFYFIEFYANWNKLI